MALTLTFVQNLSLSFNVIMRNNNFSDKIKVFWGARDFAFVCSTSRVMKLKFANEIRNVYLQATFSCPLLRQIFSF